MVNIVITTGIQGLKSLKKDWPCGDDSHYFNQYFWIENAYHSSHNQEYVFIGVYQNKRLISVFPMQILSDKILGVSAGYLGYFEPDHLFIHGLIKDPESDFNLSYKEIIRQLKKNKIKIKKIVLKRNYDDSVLKAIDTSESFFIQKIESRSNIINCDKGFENFHQSLSSNRRQGLRKKMRRLEKLDQTAIRISDATTRGAFLQAYFDLEKETWKGDKGNAITNTKSQLKFYQNLEKCDDVVVFLLQSGDAVIAAQIAVVSMDTVFIYKTSFSESYQKYSPGELLILETVRYASDNHIHFVNLITDLPWHHHLAKESRPLNTYVIYTFCLQAIAAKILSLAKQIRNVMKRSGV
jgi:lipid II:glycine glycyltransferase (peptidoglycan interpeptide bridge formation enzyme)